MSKLTVIDKLDLICPNRASADGGCMASPGVGAQIRLVRDIAELGEVWPRSDRPGAARCYAFQLADLLEIRCNTIARARGVECLFAAVVDPQGAPVLLLPLGIERRCGVRVLTFLDGGLSDYNAPVMFEPARQWRAEDMRAVWRGLLRILPAFDAAVFEKMPERVGDLLNPLMLLGASPHVESGHAVNLCGTWEDFASKRLPNRREYRRRRRRLQERGTLSFEIASTPEQCDAFLEALIRQKTRRHLETLGTAGFDQPGYRDFVMETTRCLCARGPVHLSALRLNETIIAAHWGYAGGSRFYHLIPSYEGGPWRPFSPGRLLTEHLLEWSFRHGIGAFDFGIGDEDYKDEYCDVVIPLHVVIVPVTFKGVVYAWGTHSMRILKRSGAWAWAKSMLSSGRRQKQGGKPAHCEPAGSA